MSRPSTDDAAATALAALAARHTTPPGMTRSAGKNGRFGTQGLRSGTTLFAMSWQGVIAVRLSEARVRALVARGDGGLLVMGPRTMKRWLVVPDASRWPALLQEALEAVNRA